MDPLIISGVCGEGGAVAVSPLTPLSTLERSGAPDAHGPTGLDLTRWSGEARKRGTAGVPPGPPHCPSSRASTNTKTPAPRAPHPQTQRRRASSWDSPSLCHHSSGSSNLRRARTERSRRRCRETRDSEAALGGEELTASVQRTKTKTVLSPNPSHQNTACYFLNYGAQEEQMALHYSGMFNDGDVELNPTHVWRLFQRWTTAIVPDTLQYTSEKSPSLTLLYWLLIVWLFEMLQCRKCECMNHECGVIIVWIIDVVTSKRRLMPVLQFIWTQTAVTLK